MKLGDKVKLKEEHKSDVLADNLSNEDEGDITTRRARKIEDLVESDAIFVVTNLEVDGVELRPESESWTIYGLHNPDDLILV